MYRTSLLRGLLLTALLFCLCSFAPVVWAVGKWVVGLIVSYAGFVGLDIAAEKSGLKDKLYGDAPDPALGALSGETPGDENNNSSYDRVANTETDDGSILARLLSEAETEDPVASANSVNDLLANATNGTLIQHDRIDREVVVDQMVAANASLFSAIPYWYQLVASNSYSAREFRLKLEAMYSQLTGLWSADLSNKEVTYNVIDFLRANGDRGLEAAFASMLEDGSIDQEYVDLFYASKDDDSYRAEAEIIAAWVTSLLLEEGGDYAAA